MKQDRHYQRRGMRLDGGFTLVEFLLVFALILVLAIVTLPLSVRYYQIQVLDETVGDVAAALNRAYVKAAGQENDAAYGIRVLPNAIVLFQGNTYTARVVAADETFPLGFGLSAQGLQEVTFAKLSGLPNVTGTIILSIGQETRSIAINAKGLVE